MWSTRTFYRLRKFMDKEPSRRRWDREGGAVEGGQGRVGAGIKKHSKGN